MNVTSDQLVLHKKVYEIWLGKNKFLKDGKYFIGSEFQKGIFLFFFILCQYFLTVIFVILMQKGNILSKIICSICETGLMYLIFLYGIQCVIGDPGAIQFNSLSFMPKNGLKLIFLDEESKPRYYNLRGRMYRIKMCRTCLITRPLGTSHCKICNICVEKYDHHCPWVGNCIGRNNYSRFFFFVCSLNLLVLFTITISVTNYVNLSRCTDFLDNEWAYTGVNNFSEYNCSNYLDLNITLQTYDNESMLMIKINDNESISFLPFEYTGAVKARQCISLVLSLVNLVELGFVSTLFFCHTKIILLNLTTALKSKLPMELKIMGNPFDYGISKNLKTMLCTKHRQRVNYSQTMNICIGNESMEVLEKSRQDEISKVNMKPSENIGLTSSLNNSRENGSSLVLGRRIFNYTQNHLSNKSYSNHHPCAILKSKSLEEETYIYKLDNLNAVVGNNNIYQFHRQSEVNSFRQNMKFENHDVENSAAEKISEEGGCEGLGHKPIPQSKLKASSDRQAVTIDHPNMINKDQ